MNDRLVTRLRVAAVAGWWTILIAIGLALLFWMVWLRIFLKFSVFFVAILAIYALVVFVTLKMNKQARPSVKATYYVGAFISASLLLYAIGGFALFIYCVKCDPGLFARHWSWVPHPYIFGGTLIVAFLLFWPVALATLVVWYFGLKNTVYSGRAFPVETGVKS